jgi:tetratricopeptide (TPR) repeat protein
MSLASLAQSASDVGKIALSVVIPENADGLNASQLSKLETKIAQIVTKYGLAASGYNNNFIIYPKFEIYESNTVEGGMQNITIVTAEVSLFIKQVDNNILFATISRSLKGSGSSKQIAITNAISKIPTNDAEFSTFLETGKTRIIQYYEAKCSDIVKKSESHVQMQQYEQALGLLMSVPEEVSSCYNQIQDKAIEAYKAYQSQRCAELIQKAKTTLAANNYAEALNILGEIDPSANCFNEAQALGKTAENKVDAEEKKLWDFQMKQYNDVISLKKQRINAIKEIAVSYYKSQPTTVNYNYIIR